MSEERAIALLAIGSVVLFAIGLATLCILVTKWKKRFFYRPEGTDVLNIISNGNYLQVHVVRNANECQNAMTNIRTYVCFLNYFIPRRNMTEICLFNLFSHCVEYNVVGVHSICTKTNVPDLIVLATHRGLCVIIRLCLFKKTLPIELKVRFNAFQIQNYLFSIIFFTKNFV